MPVRFSLRTTLLAVAAVAIVVWFGVKVASFERRRQAESYLEAHGLIIGGIEHAQIEWSGFFLKPEPQFINTIGYTLTKADWDRVALLGDIYQLSLHGPQCNSPEFAACIRKNRLHMQEIGLRECKLTPDLCAAIGECSGLKSLVCRDVEAEGEVTIQPLPQLAEVYLFQSPLGERNLQWIARQPALKEFVDDGENLSRNAVFDLVAKGTLEEVCLPRITLAPPEVELILGSSLVRIDCRKTSIASSQLATLMQCERIRGLEITAAQFDAVLKTHPSIVRDGRLNVDIHGLAAFIARVDIPWSKSIKVRQLTVNGAVLGALPGSPVPVMVED